MTPPRMDPEETISRLDERKLGRALTREESRQLDYALLTLRRHQRAGEVGTRPRWTADHHQRMLTGHREGKTVNQIAADLGRSPQAVAQRLNWVRRRDRQ